MTEDKVYQLWLNQVKNIANHYKIKPKNLLNMLYINNKDFDYRELYN
jgi:hypothetical protein